VAVKRLEWRGKEIEPAVRLREAPILVISGSLRRDSINSAVARAAAVAAARDDLAFTIDDSPRALPHFNPDFEPFPPEVVRRFRQACGDARAVLLAVPEYTSAFRERSRTRSIGWSAAARRIGSRSQYSIPPRRDAALTFVRRSLTFCAPTTPSSHTTGFRSPGTTAHER
jgi:hypothetical protein